MHKRGVWLPIHSRIDMHPRFIEVCPEARIKHLMPMRMLNGGSGQLEKNAWISF